MNPYTIHIVGAGIGGLTTGLALQQKGIASIIYEQSAALRPVGAGIIMANNAMQIYQKLGLREAIEDLGNPIHSMQITDHHLNPISGIDLAYFERKHGVRNVAIHRGTLQHLLASKLSAPLKLGFKLNHMEVSDGYLELDFDQQGRVQTKNVIGADGVNSVVRQCMFQSQKRSAQQTCWRGIANMNLSARYRHQLTEAWGPGARIGFVQIDNEKVYWYAVISNQPNKQIASKDLNLYFKAFHPLTEELFQQTDYTGIHVAQLEDLALMKTWYQGQVCLLGDAAHATTPNLGQGACQAIEDAYWLAECLDQYALSDAFRRYQRIRMAKAHEIVQTSWHIGKMAHWQNPLSRKLRNNLMRWTPNRISRRQSAKIFELQLDN